MSNIILILFHIIIHFWVYQKIYETLITILGSKSLCIFLHFKPWSSLSLSLSHSLTELTHVPCAKANRAIWRRWTFSRRANICIVTINVRRYYYSLVHLSQFTGLFENISSFFFYFFLTSDEWTFRRRPMTIFAAVHVYLVLSDRDCFKI